MRRLGTTVETPDDRDARAGEMRERAARLRAVWPVLVCVRRALEREDVRRGHLLAVVLDRISLELDRVPRLEDAELRALVYNLPATYARQHALAPDHEEVRALAVLREALGQADA
jgi:hypothetical protein